MVNLFLDYLALLLPLLLLQLALLVLALRDLIRRPSSEVTGGNKLLWGIGIVLFSVIGPLIYFALGRGRE